MAKACQHPAVDPKAERRKARETRPGSYTARTQILETMQQQLRRHSALEDLGPLFAPEAQGLQPSGQPTPRSRQA